jgi:hypothetical protein
MVIGFALTRAINWNTLKTLWMEKLLKGKINKPGTGKLFNN